MVEMILRKLTVHLTLLILFSVLIFFYFPVVIARHVTRLTHQGGAKSFLRGGPKFYKLCPIVVTYVQNIFPGGRKIYREVSPPLCFLGYGPGDSY